MTNDQYTKLIAWIGEQPPGQTAEQLHAAFHAPSVAARNPLVPRWRIKELLYGDPNGAWAALAAIAAESPLAATALAYLGDTDFENLNLDNPAVSVMFDALQEAGVLSAPLRATVDALADTVITPAESLGLASAQVGNFASALNMMEAPQ